MVEIMENIEKVIGKEKIVVSLETDWNLVFEELNKQWSKSGRMAQSVTLTNDDFIQIQYRLGMKLNQKKAIVENDCSDFTDYFAALKYIALAARLLENLVRSKNCFASTIGVLNPIEIVKAYLDEEEYEEYCTLMDVEGNFLGRKNI